MRDLVEPLVELVRQASTDLPADVEEALVSAREREASGSAARGALDTILQNVSLARRTSVPICQDTGTPIFHVGHPAEWSTRELRRQVRAAVAEATRRNYLRPNAVGATSGRNTGDNVGDEAFPALYFEETEGDDLVVALMLKGGGCENVGAQYFLPDESLGAGRDPEGVRRAVLDAVHRAQGRGCAPGILGVAVGGDRATSYHASKKVLLRKTGEASPDPELAGLEARLFREANQLGIGPMGFGGATTVLGVKMASVYRHPASFFVSVSYMCWADRRRRMVVRGDAIAYE